MLHAGQKPARRQAQPRRVGEAGHESAEEQREVAPPVDDGWNACHRTAVNANGHRHRFPCLCRGWVVVCV